MYYRIKFVCLLSPEFNGSHSIKMYFAIYVTVYYLFTGKHRPCKRDERKDSSANEIGSTQNSLNLYAYFSKAKFIIHASFICCLLGFVTISAIVTMLVIIGVGTNNETFELMLYCITDLQYYICNMILFLAYCLLLLLLTHLPYLLGIIMPHFDRYVRFLAMSSGLFWICKPRSENPFCTGNKWDKFKPPVIDQEKREKVLKQPFRKEKIPDNLDAIVIGSGIGGLTVAAILSRAGKRVLVLEQHDRAGGCCHTFICRHLQFDFGIHYVGGMDNRNPSVSKVLLDQISDGQIHWKELDKNYDSVHIGNSADRKIFDILSTSEGFVESLTKHFPEEVAAIKKYLTMVEDVCKGEAMFRYIKFFPQWFVSFFNYTGLAYYSDFFQMSKKTLQDILNEITDNEDLKTVLAYNFGFYGNLPNDTSFVMHALLVNQFLNGGYYPVGGGSEIAFHIIPVIERSGGRVLVKAPVAHILLNDDNTHVTGVDVQRGKESIAIKAPLVISNAGILNTYTCLLPRHLYGLNVNLNKVKSGIATLQLFVGLRGNSEELEVKVRSNIWAFIDNNLKTLHAYVSGAPEDAEEEGIPSLFISFPSTKDPTWEERFPGKTTCTVIALAPYEWFERWKDEKMGKHSRDYHDLKKALGNKIWAQVLEMFPQLDGKVICFEIGSPLTNRYFISSPKGEIYGCDHNRDRFSPITAAILRPETPVPGLYLTGQDIYTCGFTGAMQGGLLTSMALLKRDLFKDLQDICETL